MMNIIGIRNYIVAPIVVALYFSLVSVIAWLRGEQWMMIVNYLYIGLVATVGMVMYAKLPRKRKHRARRISLFAIGLLLFLAMGVMGRINGQLEGLFFYSLAGIGAGTVSHYLVAKIIGPIVLNRGWCGWACWTIMILDLLPYKRSDGRRSDALGRLRYVHAGLSLGLVMLLWFGLGYSISRQPWDIAGMYWFLGGNLAYYGIGISLVLLLKDNRAFCKYICPVSVILKASSTFSLLRISGKSALCDHCDACTKTCPMNIRIPDYILAGQRVLSTECVMCLTCVGTCPTGALEASVGFDVAGRSLLQPRTAAENDPSAASGKRGDQVLHTIERRENE